MSGFTLELIVVSTPQGSSSFIELTCIRFKSLKLYRLWILFHIFIWMWYLWNYSWFLQGLSIFRKSFLLLRHIQALKRPLHDCHTRQMWQKCYTPLYFRWKYFYRQNSYHCVNICAVAFLFLFKITILYFWNTSRRLFSCNR